MGNLLQMSITSGQDTDSRQFTLAANSHRLAGETYDANGNRTSGSSDGFTSVSYNILNLPETVTAGGWTINYLYSAAGAKLRERVILSASEESTTDYAGNTVFRDSVLHKVLTGSGYLETTDSLQTLLSHPGYRFFITDHLGSVRVVADAQGNVLQRNVYHPYGEDYAAVYAQGGNILDGLNIGSNAQPGGEGTPEGEGEPEIDDPEPGASVGGGGPDEPIEDDGEEAAADEAPLAWPQYYRSFNPYRFSAKEQMTVYGGSLVGSNFEPNAGLYDFGARWYAPYSARWSTPDPLSEKYYSISPYAYCAGNPVNLVDPEGLELFIGQYKYKDGKLYDSEDNVVKEEQMDDFTKKVYNALCSIATTKTGQEVIDTLQNAKYGYKIQKGEKSSFSKQNVQAACYYAYPKEVQDHLNQIGSGGTIFWNEEGALLPTENGGQINSTSDLFHEMSHAFDAFHGMLDNTKFEELKKEEWQAVYRENLFRHEFKLPLRTHYYPVINIVGKFIGGTGPYMLKEGKPLKPSWYNL